ncbi:MAG: DUF4922 domain-containing protein [Bacteroidales bacterium]|jgi:glycosyltransferase involved in cell wall biosynthesis/ATP adenylyltransferase/5',5'''-P-1,P-4-tetraphosphate phosphorylase II|nr:DUF4922 domain-containing protein [Bacteroidales bacterium]
MTDAFIFYADRSSTEQTLAQFRQRFPAFHLTVVAPDAESVEGVEVIVAQHPFSVTTLRQIARHTTAPQVMLVVGRAVDVSAGWEAPMPPDVAMLYADYEDVTDTGRTPHPVIDCQEGSLRDDFDFGPVMLFSCAALQKFVAEVSEMWEHAGLYAMRLAAMRTGKIVHRTEVMSALEITDRRSSGEKLFDYVSASSRERQIEMEAACTAHLKLCGLWLEPWFAGTPLNDSFDIEASIVIPVRNRVKTIADAVDSALSQELPYLFNVIVVDNHSTDGTLDVLQRYTDPRLTVIVPERTDLGIGGCWNVALNSPHCGRFAVQLDSDDLYEDKWTLKKIISKFEDMRCAMVIGSYTLCDFQLNPMPPGLIAHTEWTPDNGPNNALRINGLGAPRAFYTPIARSIGFPNVSYGEDYAMALAISRRWKIGRIYESLYRCRRWDDNSDARLSVEQTNAHNTYKDGVRTAELHSRRKLIDSMEYKVATLLLRQTAKWVTAEQNYEALRHVLTREKAFVFFRFRLQHNPARIRSTCADVEAVERPCFLCGHKRPAEQEAVDAGEYEILVNPYPVFPAHLTIVLKAHQPQRIAGRFADMLHFSRELPGYTVFYNGPQCGASAPAHFHFQAGTSTCLPAVDELPVMCRRFAKTLVKNDAITVEALNTDNYMRCCLLLRSSDGQVLCEQFRQIYRAMPTSGDNEPMFNILATYTNEQWQVIIFPRQTLRPQQFYAEGDSRIIFSPASAEMAGLLIFPRKEDLDRATDSIIRDMLKQVAMDAHKFEALCERVSTEALK